MKLSNFAIVTLFVAYLSASTLLVPVRACTCASIGCQVDDPFAQDDDADPFGGSGDEDKDEPDPFGNASPVSTKVAPSKDESSNKNRARICTTEEIEQKLKRPAAMEYDEMAFVEVMDELRDHNGINVILDQSARDDSLTEDELITFKIRDTSLATALRLMLSQYNATYVIDDGVLRVISMDVASDPDYFRRKIFDCRELLAKIARADSRVGQPILMHSGLMHRGGGGGRSGGGFGGGGGGGVFSIAPQAGGQANASAGSTANTAQQATTTSTSPLQNFPKVTSEQLLTELIRISIDPDGWEDTNGDGTIMVLGGLLVVAQTQTVLEEIEQLLEDLNRNMK